MGQANEKQSTDIGINEKNKKPQLQKDQPAIKFKYISSQSILNNFKTHKCSYEYEEKDSKIPGQHYNDVTYQLLYFIDSKQQQMMIKILKKYSNSTISKEIVSYLNHSDKCLSSYHITCHSNNIKVNNAIYTIKPVCAEFLQSKLAICNNYYKHLSPVFNMAMIGRAKIGKTAFGLRWEQNKPPSFFGSSNKNCYEKEILLSEEEQIVNIENDFGFVYDDTNSNSKDLKRLKLNVDISKVFVRIIDIKNNESIDYKNMDVIFMCYAINDKKSFEYLQNYLFKNKSVQHVVKIFVGLKSEMRNESFYKRNPNYLVSVKDVMKIAQEYEIPYFEISAETGRNVQFLVMQSIYECWFKRCKVTAVQKRLSDVVTLR